MDETKSNKNMIFYHQTCFAKLSIHKNDVRESTEFSQGGPAACQQSAGHHELEGIMSFSFDNRKQTSYAKNRLGVFTTTSNFIDWIRSEQIA